MTIRPVTVVGALVLVHALDVLTFWLALSVYGVPIGNEQNGLMAGAYLSGGFYLVAVTKLAIVAFALSVLARVTTKPFWPVFGLFLASGLVGMTANVVFIFRYGGI